MNVNEVSNKKKNLETEIKDIESQMAGLFKRKHSATKELSVLNSDLAKLNSKEREKIELIDKIEELQKLCDKLETKVGKIPEVVEFEKACIELERLQQKLSELNTFQ